MQRRSRSASRAPRQHGPSGFRLSAQHIELDIDFALSVDCDHIIMDGRGGGTGAIFRNNISVPTMAAIARAPSPSSASSPTSPVCPTAA